MCERGASTWPPLKALHTISNNVNNHFFVRVYAEFPLASVKKESIKQLCYILEDSCMDIMTMEWKVWCIFSNLKFTRALCAYMMVKIFIFAGFFNLFGTIKRLQIARNRKVCSLNSSHYVFIFLLVSLEDDNR